ncbi:hypothetical protein [Paenibacillus sp. 1001270B_150601_E10]|uniref:hypothetical protein n=1 Tax=Paenibacillus sp. 1001270B_150601_E10 TaxID=2787079 RepID=UPI00189D606A|nr:hypothetical protein [Paenibacillus sp. 1001270B_150601_E10]
MISYTQEDWAAYIAGLVSEEQRQQMEAELEQSDEALALYLLAMEESASMLPPIEIEAAQSITDSLMDTLYPPSTVGANVAALHHQQKAVQSEQLKQEQQADIPSHESLDSSTPRTRHRKWNEHPLFHYTIAAAITIIFMASGFFEALSIEPKTLIERPSGSITHGMVETFTKWFGAKP